MSHSRERNKQPTLTTSQQNFYDEVKQGDDENEVFKMLNKDPELANLISDNPPVLHIAAKTGNVKIINYLCAFGANTDGKYGEYTPLDFAREYYSEVKNDDQESEKAIEVMRLLIARGCGKLEDQVMDSLKLTDRPVNIDDLCLGKEELENSNVIKLFAEIEALKQYGLSLQKKGEKEKDKKALDAGWDAYHYAFLLKRNAMDCINSPADDNKAAFNQTMTKANKSMSNHRGYGKKALAILKNIAYCTLGIAALIFNLVVAAIDKRAKVKDVFFKARTTRQEKLKGIKNKADTIFDGKSNNKSRRK